MTTNTSKYYISKVCIYRYHIWIPQPFSISSITVLWLLFSLGDMQDNIDHSCATGRSLIFALVNQSRVSERGQNLTHTCSWPCQVNRSHTEYHRNQPVLSVQGGSHGASLPGLPLFLCSNHYMHTAAAGTESVILTLWKLQDIYHTKEEWQWKSNELQQDKGVIAWLVVQYWICFLYITYLQYSISLYNSFICLQHS